LIEVLVVVAVIALLVAILLPSLAAARAQARAVLCMNNVKQIGLAARMYAMEFKDTFPSSAHGGTPDPKTWWLHILTRYSKAPLLFQCPDDERRTSWTGASPCRQAAS
jgi:type II secretory pathway pseudopilin PulG